MSRGPSRSLPTTGWADAAAVDAIGDVKNHISGGATLRDIRDSLDGINKTLSRIANALESAPSRESATPSGEVVWPDGPRVVSGVLKSSKLSHKDLAKVLGVTSSTISKWANGDHKPRGQGGKRLLAIAASYSIEVE